MNHPRIVLIAALVVGFAGACDNNEPSKLSQLVEASQTPPAPPPDPVAQKPPAPPAAPTIALDDSSCTINGEVVLFNTADAAGRIAGVLTGKPLIEGEVVAVDTSRDTKVPKVAAVLGALKNARAKGMLVRTPRRDSTMGQLQLSIDHPAVGDCSAVGMVNRDGSIAAWPVAGGVAKRFARGLAGPDITLGSEGVQKLGAGCDSSVWFLAADDSLPWALPFDLALATVGQDGGSIRAAHTVLVTTPAVPGRKLVNE
jgi:hypothetical protein